MSRLDSILIPAASSTAAMDSIACHIDEVRGVRDHDLAAAPCVREFRPTEVSYLQAPAPQDIPLPGALTVPAYTQSARKDLRSLKFRLAGYSGYSSGTSSTEGSGATTPERDSGSGSGSTSGGGSGNLRKSLSAGSGSTAARGSGGSAAYTPQLDYTSANTAYTPQLECMSANTAYTPQRLSQQTVHVDSFSTAYAPRHLNQPSTAQPLVAIAAIAVMKAMGGTWLGERGESYTLQFFQSTRWGCICWDAQGTTTVELSFDEERGLIWWGKNKTFFMSGAEVVANDRCARWYVSKDTLAQSPRFVWTRQEQNFPCRQAAAPGLSPQRDMCGNGAFAEAAARSTSDVAAAFAEAAASATREVTEILLEQGGQGKIWLPHWNEQYHDKLGPLREFLQAHPDKFNVTTSRGLRKYTVALVEPTASAKLRATRERLSELAAREVMRQVLAQGDIGLVALPDWKERFSPHLGTLRSFLEGRPEFAVVPTRGGHFRVARA